MPAVPTPSFPPASGSRIQWDDTPESVRRAVELRLGSQVVAAHSQSGGFSPGVAARLELADGGRAFVKAVCGTPNPQSPELHRREARIAAALPAYVPAPALRFAYDDGEWIVLVFDDVDGHNPELPWRAEDLERVLGALHELSVALTPAPIQVDTAHGALGRLLGGWQRVIDDGLGADQRIAPGLRERVDELVALESRWPDVVTGDTLLHLDLRADNMLLTKDRVFFIDWPGAAIGAAWLDLAAMLPSIAMQGGRFPEDVWRAHPLSVGVEDEDVDAFIAALVGYFVHSSLLPAPPGLPTLREFQAAQGEHATRWLARRRGWDDLR
jgi:aminoglycoside phosphotransferase (APT) family kinase protein